MALRGPQERPLRACWIQTQHKRPYVHTKFQKIPPLSRETADTEAQHEPVVAREREARGQARTMIHLLISFCVSQWV